jgi:hypothetical protein
MVSVSQSFQETRTEFFVVRESPPDGKLCVRVAPR